jgi:hypothetical protein
MKKILSCFLIIMCMLPVGSQIIYMETGKMISSFRYKDSKGQKLENLKGSNQNNLGLGLRLPIKQSSFHFLCGGAYNRYGAMGSNPVLGNYYEWDVTYFGANAGFEYEFFEPTYRSNNRIGFSFHIKTSFAAEFLLNGTQNLNNQIYDLAGKEEFDRPLYFIRGGVGVNYYISKIYAVFVEYMGGTSFLIGDYKNQEQLRLITHNVSVGLSINLFFQKN